MESLANEQFVHLLFSKTTFFYFSDKEYLVHFTSTTPFHMRYMLLNADPSDAIKIMVWYSRSNRLDVFVDGVYVQPTNARTTAGGNVVLDTPTGDNTLVHRIFFLRFSDDAIMTEYSLLNDLSPLV